MINVQSIRARVDLVDLVQRFRVELRKAGSEYEALCPFHTENTPSFRVVPSKGFVHCFGCGVHYDVIGFVMAMEGCDFVQACHKLGGHDSSFEARAAVRSAPVRVEGKPSEIWVPLLPVPDDAPMWEAGREGRVWNIKRGRWWMLTPSRADAYRAADGSVLGYVLRTEIDGKKLTPTVTWCIGPRGQMQWCLQPFPEPRPLMGLDQLALKPDAPVLMVEGEKCQDRARNALTPYACATWPGGSKGVRFVDFSPLAGRDVVLWPDADEGGLGAMLGYVDGSGLIHEGVAQRAHRAGVRSIRVVDVSVQAKGWDLADALDDGWTPQQLAGWARTRVRPVVLEQTEAMAV